MSTLSTLVYQYLKTAFGALDWEQGSVIRELVAEPLVGLADVVNTEINNTYAQLDVQTLLDNPTQYSEEIDNLFTSLGLDTPTPTQSTGTIKILTSSDKDIDITGGTVFTYLNYSLSSVNITKITRNPTSASDAKLYQLGVNAYYAIIPVVSIDVGVTIGSGTAVEWYDLGSDVYSAVVDSTITGGIGVYTAIQKINAIKQALFPAVLTCREGIIRAINYYLPDSAVDCAFSPNQPGGRTEVYVKTTAAPQHWYIADFLYKSTDGRKITIPKVGIAAVEELNHDPDVVFQVIENGDNLEINTTATEITEVKVYGLPTLSDIQSALDRFTQGTGISIRVMTPILLDLSITLPINSGTVTNDLMLNIVDLVNNTGLDPFNVGDNLIKPILTNAGIISQTPGTYTLKNPITGNVTQSLVMCDASPFMRQGAPYAIYTSIDRLEYPTV